MVPSGEHHWSGAGLIHSGGKRTAKLCRGTDSGRLAQTGQASSSSSHKTFQRIRQGLPDCPENRLPVISKKAEIIPGIGLGGLLLGQSLQSLEWEEHWQESDSIVRGTLQDGSVLVTGDQVTDRIVGLEAQASYQGELPGGIRLGTDFSEARQLMPQLRPHDLLSGLYEPERLGFLLLGEEIDESILVCDFGHDYWTFARPLLEEEEYDE